MDCHTCDRQLRPQEPACGRCGTPPGQPAVSPGARTYPLVGVGTAASVLVGVTSAGYLATYLVAPLISASLARSAAETLDIDRLQLADELQLYFLPVLVVLFLAAGTLVIIWLWRARRNLDAFPGASPGMRAGWAIGGWFIPIANLTIPFKVTDSVARGSLWHHRTHPLVGWWWGALLLAGVAGRVEARMADSAAADLPFLLRDRGDFLLHAEFHQGAPAYSVVSGLLFVAAGILLTVLIRRISLTQTARLVRGSSTVPAASAPSGGSPVAGTP